MTTTMTPEQAPAFASPLTKRAKLHYDGSNWLAYLPVDPVLKAKEQNASQPDEAAEEEEKKMRLKKDYGLYVEEYDAIYLRAVEFLGKSNGYIRRKELAKAISFAFNRMKENHPEAVEAGVITRELVAMNMDRIYKKYLARFKTLKRKVMNNRWNWFITLSYDTAKMTEEQFVRSVKVCLNHLADRRGWRYFAKFEDGELNGRRHLHIVAWIPDGEMVGTIEKRGNFNKKKHRYVMTQVNTFFEERFGWNEFAEIDQLKLRSGGFTYLTKYMSKDDSKFIYSRGVPTEYEVDLTDDDFVRDEEGRPVTIDRFVQFLILNSEAFLFDPFTDSFHEGEYIETFDELDAS